MKVGDKRSIGSGVLVLALSGFLLALGVSGNAFAGKTERAAKCLKGDTKVVRGIAKGVVKHAIKRFDIADLVDAEKTKKARKEVYQFLDWKLGSPSAICGQYVTAGQKHFNKGYSDEAAAALLGSELPGDGSAKMQLPKEFSAQLKAQVDAQGANAAEMIQKEYGIPAEVSKIIIDEVTSQANKQIGRIGFNMPKSWDVDNRLVEGLIAAERKQ